MRGMKKGDINNMITYTVERCCQCGLYGAQVLLSDTADSMHACMMEEKREFSKDSGCTALHMIASFDREMMEHVSPQTALRIGYDISAACFPGF